METVAETTQVEVMTADEWATLCGLLRRAQGESSLTVDWYVFGAAAAAAHERFMRARFG